MAYRNGPVCVWLKVVAESRDIVWLQGYLRANETHGDISLVDLSSSAGIKAKTNVKSPKMLADIMQIWSGESYLYRKYFNCPISV